MKYFLICCLLLSVFTGCDEDNTPDYYIDFTIDATAYSWTEGFTMTGYGDNTPFTFDHPAQMDIYASKVGGDPSNLDDFISIGIEFTTNVSGEIDTITYQQIEMKLGGVTYTNVSCNIAVTARGNVGESVAGTFTGEVANGSSLLSLTGGSFRVLAVQSPK